MAEYSNRNHCILMYKSCRKFEGNCSLRQSILLIEDLNIQVIIIHVLMIEYAVPFLYFQT